MRKFELYRVVEDHSKGLILERDESGFYSIAKLPKTKDNIFASVQEIEIVIGHKLEFMEEQFVNDE